MGNKNVVFLFLNQNIYLLGLLKVLSHLDGCFEHLKHMLKPDPGEKKFTLYIMLKNCVYLDLWIGFLCKTGLLFIYPLVYKGELSLSQDITLCP